MREIKFRAWNYGLRKMIEVHSIHFALGKITWQEYPSINEKINMTANYTNNLIKVPDRSTAKDRDELEYILELEHFRDSNSILMQFTGLLDSKGKEIYEGDIVKNHNCFYVVKWHEEEICFFFQWFYGEHDNIFKTESLKNFWNKSEILGNIYENPELLGIQDEPHPNIAAHSKEILKVKEIKP